MFREALDEVSAVFRRMAALIVTAGTVAMVFAFVANRLGLTGEQYWMFLTVVVALSLLTGFTLVLVRLSDRTGGYDSDLALLAVATDAFVSSDADLIDERHRIDRTEQTIDLTNNGDDVVMTEHWEVTNVKNEPSEGFKYYYESESFLQDGGTTARQIRNDGQRVEMDLEPVNINDQFVGIHRARFEPELEKGESIEFEIENEMGSLDLSVGQYLYYDFNRFERGVRKAICRVVVDTPPETVKAYEVVNTMDMTHQNDPTKLDFEIEEVEVHSDAERRKFWIEQRDLQDTVFIYKLEW